MHVYTLLHNITRDKVTLIPQHPYPSSLTQHLTEQ